MSAAQQLRDQLLASELRRSSMVSVVKRVSERGDWLAKRRAAGLSRALITTQCTMPDMMLHMSFKHVLLIMLLAPQHDFKQ